MPNIIITVLHAFCFDLTTPAGSANWERLKKERRADGAHVFSALAEYAFEFKLAKLDGQTIPLETKHVFADQWNTGALPGFENGTRVFDFRHCFYPGSGERKTASGYWLEQTSDMRDIRRDTHECGYCGKQELRVENLVYADFCSACLDSPYLKSTELHLLRLRSVAVSFTVPRSPLTAAESDILLPKYREAQIHGSTKRGVAAREKARRDVVIKAARSTANAITERDGMLWILDHFGNMDNVIYYSHTQRFCFGWRSPVDAAVLSSILDKISEFPFAYEIKTTDKGTLSGD